MLMLGQRDPAPPPGRIADDQLRLIFACCHPALDPGARVALTLRILCGLSTAGNRQVVPCQRGNSGAAAGASQAEDTRRSHTVPHPGRRGSAGPDRRRDAGGVPGVHGGASGQHGFAGRPGELCDEAVRLAPGRLLAGLCPGDPEVAPDCSRCCCSPTPGETPGP